MYMSSNIHEAKLVPVILSNKNVPLSLFPLGSHNNPVHILISPNCFIIIKTYHVEAQQKVTWAGVEICAKDVLQTKKAYFTI